MLPPFDADMSLLPFDADAAARLDLITAATVTTTPPSDATPASLAELLPCYARYAYAPAPAICFIRRFSRRVAARAADAVIDDAAAMIRYGE